MTTRLSNDEVLQNLAYHVFVPPELPQSELEEAADQQISLQIARSVISAVHKYKKNDPRNTAQWDRVASMLEHVLHFIRVPLDKDGLSQHMADLKTGDTLALYIRAQNTAVLIRKKSSTTVFEVFEVQAPAADVMSTAGKLVRHYPGPAVELPNSVAGDGDFIEEISSFLEQMDTEGFKEAGATTRKAGSEVDETRDSAHPNYFIQLFFGILRGMGEVVNPPRVVKRIADEVLWKKAAKPWRRSPIWLIIRVAIQTSLDSKLSYKCFMTFYHADILSQCLKIDAFLSDLLFAMRVKVARRLFKLGDSAPKYLIQATAAAAEATQTVLQRRWNQVQTDQAQSRKWQPSATDLSSAKNQTLPNSRQYLEKVFQGRPSVESHLNFIPNHQIRLENVHDFARYANGNLASAFSADKHVALFDFEASVFENLASWTSRNLRNTTNACKTMLSCFEQYKSAATSYYTIDVADQSIMVLTLMRLWMAIDQLTTAGCPLLLDFSPEIAPSLLDKLLLRTWLHIDQARIIQQHIRSRHKRAVRSNNSIFSDEASEHCLGVQYFRRSPRLRALKLAIEKDAQQERDEKLQELDEKNEEYTRLDKMAKEMSHEFFTNYRKRRVHNWYCNRCSVEQSRNELQIELHEWPLPTGQLDAELVVFELERPEMFTIWRDVTYGILRNLGSAHRESVCDAYITLEDYDGLRQWISATTEIEPRLVLASTTKPFTMAHYSATRLKATEDRVCVKNALRLRLYDRQGGTWASGSFNDASFDKFGTFNLPTSSSYRYLQYALEGTTHSSNKVLADQADCPQDLSLHEHISFGTLRSGPLLQWMNIARGLEENILTFSAEEVKLLHTQAAWQVGRLSADGSREWHTELEKPEYAKLLVSQSQQLLKRVEVNWLEATSLSLVVLLVSRLLASSPNRDGIPEAYTFLREARRVAFKWLEELQNKLQSTEIEADILDYQTRVCEMAAICRSTFDVDPIHTTRLLGTPDDFAVFIKCSIARYDSQPPNVHKASKGLQVLLCRDRRLSHKTFSTLLSMIRLDNQILCKPLSDVWPHYRAGIAGWKELTAPNTRWISTTTAAQDKEKIQSVHFNLLEGQLLIDGKPLGRLPPEYIQHSTYVRLFGQKIVDVVPANSPGMVFATRDSIHGYKVSFSLSTDGRELLIQAEDNRQTLELVPHSHLSADFPKFLSVDYHHWAELKNKTVEFRPLPYPWSSSHRQWLLEFSHHGATTLNNVETRANLIDMHSTCFRLLSQRLSPLESSRYVHITIPTSLSSQLPVQVDLPRMKLSFFLNQNRQLESHNFRGQIVDSNQSTGTMLGLQNQLVLCAKDSVAQSSPGSRSVLIPYGNVQFAKKDHHVLVTIQPDSDRHVSFHRYLIDTDLGYLRSDSGLTSRLFKIYLHALTSHCLPDPLTRHTGTEQALSELSEPASSSFDQIDMEQAKLLELIGSLTPRQVYYPPHLKRMQTIDWANLPSLSQHFAFCVAVSNIISRAKTLQLFCSLDFTLKTAFMSPGDDLLKRFTRRSGIYYPSDQLDFREQILDLDARKDKVCTGRDNLTGEWRDVGQAAAWASRLVVRNWGHAAYNPCDLVSLAESWNTLHGVSDNLDLTYSSLWLNLTPSNSWITIYDLCRQANPSDKYALSTCLASAAFSQKLSSDQSLLMTLVAFATNPAFRSLPPPSDSLFDLEDGYLPNFHRVENIVVDATREVDDTPAGTLTQGEDESDDEFEHRQCQFFGQNVQRYRSELVRNLISHWPSTQLTITSEEYESWFNVEACLTEVEDYFTSCARNIELREHLERLERVLSSQPTSKNIDFTIPTIFPLAQPTSSLVPVDPWSMHRLDAFMVSRPCPPQAKVLTSSRHVIPKKLGTVNNTHRLSALFNEFKHDARPLNCRYGHELDESRVDLMRRRPLAPLSELPPNGVLVKNGMECQSQLRAAFQQLSSCLSPSAPTERVASIAGVWPRITPRTLLRQLSLKSRIRCDISPRWRNGLIAYAQLFIEYQRSQRLISLAAAGNKEEFCKEVDHTTGESNKETPDPDWLLVQIEGNFSARLIQRQVASEMISPSSGKNTVLQLNMGEGKSSVLVPIIAASLANTEQLVRVVVLKPLWRQMFHLLVNRLSGLAQRRIYYLPFGRHIRVDKPKAQQLQELYEECMREGGILLAQPEHILSFKLMGIDQLISSKEEEQSAANQLRDMQSWLARYARDILDESDEILHVRYQLVYTVGEQQSLEDHPDRWTTTQQVLHLAAGHISRIESRNAGSFECETKGPGRFPLIRIMADCKKAIEQGLIDAIAKDVLAGRISNLNCGRLPASVRKLALKFLTARDLPFQQYQLLEQSCDPAMQKGLLLVRGLLASGILVFALKYKHYRVDYGLDLSRSTLAVPYRAKDIPSLRAEFGHPDVAVVLTCLSYYYGGLNKDQLEQCFELLFKQDNPSLEYEQWVTRDENMPDELRQLNGINIKDHEQFRHTITPIFSHNSAVVDFYLSFIVFPKAAKEFPHKLSTSGWDLAERKSHVTTGFSGTNDNRYLLPTSITQEDPVGQLSTNALVLTYLLQPENNHYIRMCGERGEKLSTRGFLKLLVDQKPEIRVLLDVGAQMLELQNEELIRCWLELRPDVEAAVYFNDKDEIVVLPQNGSPSPLYSSPFAQQLDKCIVYLDDGHTRGTDLKLPRDYRALVTLGPKVTKDRLLQGCMRMRNLGHGQSVIFAAPVEIDRQIRSAAPNPLDPDEQPDTLDVLRWAMLETCKDLQHHVSHWAQQGIEYKRRASAQQLYEATLDISILENGWKTPESRSLKELYAIPSPADTSARGGDFTQRAFGNSDLRQRLTTLGVKMLDDASMEEEQEREVIHEIEQEQQVERPAKGEPAPHALRQDVSYFIQTGAIPSRRIGILPLFYPFSSFGEQALTAWTPKLYASTDFLQTVGHLGPGSISDYMRPVNWIVKGPNGVLVALSPHEVNKLLPTIRQSNIISLHVYAPRVTQSMRSFSNLDFYSIPSRPKLPQPFIPSNTQLQLDLFAGQLYLSSYQDYTRICAVLGLYTFPISFEELTEIQVESDGFVKPEHRVGLVEYYPGYAICKFTTSPIPMLKDLIGQRRRGMKYLRTHMGQILHARNLTQDDF